MSRLPWKFAAAVPGDIKYSPAITRLDFVSSDARESPSHARELRSRELAMRRFIPAAALAALVLIGLLTTLASAASVSITFVSPSPAAGAILTTDSVAFAFTYPRKPSATAALTCALAGPTSSSGTCTAPVAEGSKGSKSGKSFSGLANGAYTFTVTLILGDGGVHAASRAFTVAADTTLPSVTINQSSTQQDPAGESPILFSVQFSENV